MSQYCQYSLEPTDVTTTRHTPSCETSYRISASARCLVSQRATNPSSAILESPVCRLWNLGGSCDDSFFVCHVVGRSNLVLWKLRSKLIPLCFKRGFWCWTALALLLIWTNGEQVDGPSGTPRCEPHMRLAASTCISPLIGFSPAPRSLTHGRGVPRLCFSPSHHCSVTLHDIVHNPNDLMVGFGVSCEFTLSSYMWNTRRLNKYW